MELRALDGDVELRDEVEGVIAGEAGEVEVFGEDQRDENSDGCGHFSWRQGGGLFCVLCGVVSQVAETVFVPAADSHEDDDAEEGRDGEPGGADLSVGKDDEGGEQGADGGAGVSADLKEGLGEAVFAAGGHAGDAGGLGVEDGGAYADEGCGGEQDGEGGGDGEQEEADEGEDHADGEGVGHGALVGEVADEGLEERGGDLVGEGDEADLGEVEVEGCLEDGIDGGQQRLHHVVEEMTEADGGEDAEEGLGFGGGGTCSGIRDSLRAHF